MFENAKANTPTVATLLMQRGDAKCRIKRTSRTEMTLIVDDGAMPEDDSVRLAIYHSGSVSGVVRILAEVVNLETSLLETEMTVSFVALHSTGGSSCLRSFLSEGLGVTLSGQEVFREGAGGAFFTFRKAKPKGTASAPPSRTKGAEQSARNENRIAVRVPVEFRIESAAFAGQAYNISNNGVYILSDEVMPERGTHVVVAFPVALHAQPFNIDLRGEVVWTMPGMSTRAGGGIGIRIDAVEDGARGQAWREYVSREAEFGA